jgi:hypothetical protein
MERDSRIVYSSTDGDLRKARDPKLKERRSDGYTPVLAGG